MSRTELAQQWRQRLHAFEQAQTSVVEWCWQQQIPEHRFYYWRRRLGGAHKPAVTTPPTFLAIDIVEHTPAPTAAPTGVRLHLAGARIELSADFDPATLRAVVIALADLAC